MDANTAAAAVATVVALAALGFTIQQTRLTRAHNRLSVQPVLDFTESFRPGERAGLRLRNVGLGPARIVSGEVWLDGRRRGEPLGKPVSDALRDTLQPDQRRPSATSFTPGAVLPTDYDAFLLSVKPYDPATDGQFVDLIGRLRMSSSTPRSMASRAPSTGPATATPHKHEVLSNGGVVDPEQ